MSDDLRNKVSSTNNHEMIVPGTAQAKGEWDGAVHSKKQMPMCQIKTFTSPMFICPISGGRGGGGEEGTEGRGSPQTADDHIKISHVVAQPY